ncbi:hypothetical protein EKO23_19605 [Nocardioides guangzhouensis]|uniref:Transglycosylase SLT domain-containing protein n=1 Tax=Nocardioides guangzhouensis TaxID=2497878 RepID=A0A4V1XYH5_9ACTN|nr:hypothetical protein [Nocardioides guangzhouensis]RYP83269.1 hypothetical protein EKO23_19605 [Nocardioides guangzhouensis]
MTKLGIRGIYEAALAAGFTPDQATTWTAIALAESGGETGAHNPRGEDSRGLWQINVAPNVRKNIWGDLSDPRVNARAAYDISNHGTDMRPWTTTHASHQGTASDYRTYLDDVSAITGYSGDPRGVEGYGSPLPPPLPPSSPSPTATMTTSYDAIDPGMQPGGNIDSDQDGLTDAFEQSVGSRPDTADTDQDSLSDAYEVAVSHTDPGLADSDADTLTDSTEAVLGTSATTWDSDQDGASDGIEVQYGADPLQADRKIDPALVAAATPPAPAGTFDTAQTGTADVQDFRGKDPWARVSIDGETVDNFTAAALQSAAQDAGTDWRVLQGSFSHDVAASGSTHAGGGVVDVVPTNGDWDGAVSALRKTGFAAWIRNVPGHGQAGSGEHIHAVLMGDEQLSDQAAIQVQSYLNNDNGLEGSAPDDGPRQFVNNRFSWEAMSATSGGVTPGLGEPGQLAAMSTSPFQIDQGAAPDQVGDFDHDGLSLAFEQSQGLDPYSPDSDSDGQPDALEALVSGRPQSPGAVAAALGGLAPGEDTDADGLSNAYEAARGLDPRLADTDSDGLSDGTEMAVGTDAHSIDTDFDGLTDRIEVQLGTDPLSSSLPDPGLPDPDLPDTGLPDTGLPDPGGVDGDLDVG